MFNCPGGDAATPGRGGDPPRETPDRTRHGRTPAKRGDGTGCMTILVVEDDPDSAYALGRLLAGLGHEVVAAADGVEAWSLLRRRRVDLVLSDWMMPGMDGLELCRRIRGLAGRPYTYVVMVTARGGGDDRLEALAAGADDFLAKPFDTRELVARLGIADRLLAMQEELRAEERGAAGAGHDRRADRAEEPPPVLRGAGDPVRPGRPPAVAALAGAAGRGPLQELQRRLRPPGRGRRPARRRRRAEGRHPGARDGRPPRRRGVRRPAPGDRPATSPAARPSGCERRSSGGPGRTAR